MSSTDRDDFVFFASKVLSLITESNILQKERLRLERIKIFRDNKNGMLPQDREDVMPTQSANP